VNINVGDVAAATDWYRRVLGLTPTTSGLRVPGDDFEIRLRPGASDRPAYARATDLGIFRMAFLVDDAADAVESIRAVGHPCPDAVWLDMGPTIPIEGLRAVFFRDPDGTCLELIEAPSG